MKPATTLALAVLATSLGGCQSLVNAFDFSRNSSASQYQIGQGDLDEGREHLQAGRFGNALAPLHRAALNPQTSGDALNALGVAYAKLGRADLAERYFVSALRIDSDNERYAANLDRFYRSDLARDARLLHAQRERAREEYQRFAFEAPDKPFEAEPEQRLVRSGGETRSITISGPQTSSRIAVGAAPVRKAEAAPARVRVSGGSITPSATARPAEISIGSPRSQTRYPARVRVGSADQQSTYPVRVRIPARPNN
ncbi:hypothetical protein K3163_12890 [Qipengyuania sp. 1NDW9]|uniref:Tetratricopeptide repeat protein n=1 Tax=Qipengyuania xiapuensis TaxID=2867236 RepID=A0ABX8ZS20_9SPHN|nr:hypothetical protein [Qipengyuania xiapuensis]MBX7494104.1 hypothetical protein [Qipengyuania xiapuensis]QZD91815.1 hypothetical protein K3162_09640 [Qipengyuania xiapuensis]